MFRAGGHIDLGLISGTLRLIFSFGGDVLMGLFSVWFEELQNVKGIRPSASTGQNTVLQLFFRRLVYLLSLPVVVFFVFEGAERPNIKRGKHVIKKGHWMKNGAEYLIEAFGFKHSTVRGVAIVSVWLHC